MPLTSGDSFSEGGVIAGDGIGVQTNVNSENITLSLTGTQSSVTPLTISGGGGASNPIGQNYVDMLGFAGSTVQVSTVQAGVASLGMRVSNDKVNWIGVYGGIPSSLSGAGVAMTVNQGYTLPMGWRYYQFTILQAATSGTTTITVNLTSGALWDPMMQLSAGTNAIGGLSAIPSGGCSIYRNINLGATGANIKGSVGSLYGGTLCNNAASPRFVKLYNKATAPTVGTDTPVITIELQANQTINWAPPIQLAFSLGIGVGATNLVADADTTAPSANDVIVNLLYI